MKKEFQRSEGFSFTEESESQEIQEVNEANTYGPIDLAVAHIKTNITSNLLGYSDIDERYKDEFDPLFLLLESDFDGYEDKIDILKKSQSREQLNDYKKSIDDERLQEKIISESGALANLAAGITTMPLDVAAIPLIPFIGGSGKTAVNLFKVAGVGKLATRMLGKKAFEGVAYRVAKGTVGSAFGGGIF